MWHEARRQERKIRGMLVDYRKRAERRRDYYEKIVGEYTFSIKKTRSILRLASSMLCFKKQLKSISKLKFVYFLESRSYTVSAGPW